MFFIHLTGGGGKGIESGWETITEAFKHGGITNMMDRLSNPAKIKAYNLAEEMKNILRPLFDKHMDDIMSGYFCRTMMEDWANDDKNLDVDVIGKGLELKDNGVDNVELITVKEGIRALVLSSATLFQDSLSVYE